MSKEYPRERGWYVADRNSYVIHRGPYKCLEAAGAVRGEMELQTKFDHMNLWPIDNNLADQFDGEYEKARIERLGSRPAP